MTNCNICVNSFSLKRTKVTCSHCIFDACSECTEKYIIYSGNEPHCMNCKTLWNTEFLVKTHTKASLKRIKESQKERLFLTEMSLLPETQEYVKYYKEIPSLRQTKKEHDEQAQFHRRNLTEGDEISRSFHKKEMCIHSHESLVAKTRLQQIDNIVNGRADGFEETEISSTHNYEHIKKCEKDSCSGFVNKKTCICGICDTKYCKQCLNVEEESHECNEDDINTVKLILKDTKPCPECGVPIHRIDGCNHMFCTQCKTPFDWKTMQIQRSGNTNPHYYRWLNERGGSDNTFQNDDQCGRIDAYNIVNNRIFNTFLPNIREQVLLTLRECEHIIFYERPNDTMTTYSTASTRDLRVKYMCNEITKTNMKMHLMKRHKVREFCIHKRQLIDLIFEVKNDFVRKILATTDRDKMIETFIEIESFKKYVKESFKNMSDIFGLKCYNWR